MDSFWFHEDLTWIHDLSNYWHDRPEVGQGFHNLTNEDFKLGNSAVGPQPVLLVSLWRIKDTKFVDHQPEILLVILGEVYSPMITGPDLWNTMDYISSYQFSLVLDVHIPVKPTRRLDPQKTYGPMDLCLLRRSPSPKKSEANLAAKCRNSLAFYRPDTKFIPSGKLP